jgi:hypothetical protein
MDPGLMVIVPSHLPARAATLNAALADTNIQVVIDRRRGERRRVEESPVVQRRQGDRRGPARVVAYVYACPVIAVEPVTAGRMLTPAGHSDSRASLDVGFRFR